MLPVSQAVNDALVREDELVRRNTVGPRDGTVERVLEDVVGVLCHVDELWVERRHFSMRARHSKG